jgi:hypothetical protein
MIKLYGRRLLKKWYLMGAGGALALALGGVSAMIAGAETQRHPSFGGGDAAVQVASAAAIAFLPQSAAASSGISIQVTGVAADDTRTVVGVSVVGRDELGDTVFPARITRLIDQEGRTYDEIGGAASQENRREKSIYFPALAQDATQVTLVMDGLEFLHHSDAVSSQGPGVPRVRIDDVWRLSFAVNDSISRAIVVPVASSPGLLGSAVVVLDAIRQAPTGTVIDGHFVGLTMEEVPELVLYAELVDQSKAAVPFVGLRSGYGSDRQQFEIRFPRTSGELTFRITGQVSGQPVNSAAAASLRGKLGGAASAEWSLALPD